MTFGSSRAALAISMMTETPAIGLRIWRRGGRLLAVVMSRSFEGSSRAEGA